MLSECDASKEGSSVVDPQEEEESQEWNRIVVLVDVVERNIDTVEGNGREKGEGQGNIDLAENDVGKFANRVLNLGIETADEHAQQIDQINRKDIVADDNLEHAMSDVGRGTEEAYEQDHSAQAMPDFADLYFA